MGSVFRFFVFGSNSNLWSIKIPWPEHWYVHLYSERILIYYIVPSSVLVWGNIRGVTKWTKQFELRFRHIIQSNLYFHNRMISRICRTSYFFLPSDICHGFYKTLVIQFWNINSNPFDDLNLTVKQLIKT